MEAVVTIKHNGQEKTFILDVGESKKGTYATLAAKPDNKVMPFGKLYVALDAFGPDAKAKKGKASTEKATATPAKAKPA